MHYELNDRMERLLEIWGSIKGIADALDCPYPTVSSWNQRGVPGYRFKEIIKKAKLAGHIVTGNQLIGIADDQIHSGEDRAA